METSKRKQSLVAIVLVHALAGCSGLSLSSTTAADFTGSGSPVARVYESWTHQSCGPNDWCGVKFAAAAGIHPDGQRGGALTNPKPGMSNPDPEWLPGWDQLPGSDDDARDVFEALSLAAARKSWSSECRKAYGTLAQQLDQRVAETNERVAKARSTADPHARLQALLAIPKRPSSSKLDEFREGFDAAAFEAERAIAHELGDQDKLWLLAFEPITLSENARETLAPRWPSGLEETAFCMRAASHGHGDLPALRDSVHPSVERIRGLVKPLFSEEQERAVEQEREKRSAIAKKALGYADATRPAKLQQLSTRSTEDIVRFHADGGRAVVETQTLREYNRSIGELCSDSKNRIGACPTMRVKKEARRTIEFSSWPKGLVLEKGDAITFFGIVDESSVSGSGTPVEKLVERMRGLHVRSVKKSNGAETRFLVAK